jgi:3-hydroxyacyl-CoA dehydrogenase/3a,7a,12a-trihydroxy-5b-cholest-24-enoyl-CoA hydratase
MKVDEVFEAIGRALKGSEGAALAKKIRGVIVYNVGGDTWTVDLKSGMSVTRGAPSGKANLTITTSAKDFIAIAENKLKPQAAFMRGKLKIKGNMGMAMKLQSVTDAARKAGFGVGAPAAAPAAASSSPAPSSAGGAAFAELEAALASQGPGLVKKVKGIIQFCLKSPESTWTLDLKTGTGTLAQGPWTGPKPNLVITVSDTDFASLAAGKLKPQAAFMRGKIKIKGNMGMAMKLQAVFSAARASKL